MISQSDVQACLENIYIQLNNQLSLKEKLLRISNPTQDGNLKIHTVNTQTPTYIIWPQTSNVASLWSVEEVGNSLVSVIIINSQRFCHIFWGESHLSENVVPFYKFSHLKKKGIEKHDFSLFMQLEHRSEPLKSALCTNLLYYHSWGLWTQLLKEIWKEEMQLGQYIRKILFS